jgi:hypothetical protein
MKSLLLIISFIALSWSDAQARLVVHKNPLDSVLDAQLVVIVRQAPVEEKNLFEIEEIFLGDKRRGDYLDLGKIKLETIQQYGSPIVEPITPDTRILLFLRRKKDSPTLWEPTYYQEFLWVQRPKDVDVLRNEAEHAIDERHDWEAAVNLSDPKLRVEALWPFLSLQKCGVSFSQHTQRELAKAKPASGEYFAEHFDEMSSNDRMLLLAGAGAYGSQQLHLKLTMHLSRLRKNYEDFVMNLGRVPNETDWNSIPAVIPELIKDATGELYYGLAGLASFANRSDLPYIRDAALWATKYRLEQMADAAVDAFRDMPDPGNLPTIDTVVREFLPGRRAGMWSLYYDAEDALCKHRYPATIPLLTPFLSDSFLTEEVRDCLTQIVGRDLGPEGTAWRNWYKAEGRHARVPNVSPK